VSSKNSTDKNGTGKNSTGNNGTGNNSPSGKHGAFSILGFGEGVGGLEWGLRVWNGEFGGLCLGFKGW